MITTTNLSAVAGEAHKRLTEFRESRQIEHTYNRRRRQRVLGKLTPVEFELAFAEAELAA